jgi:hypothetical protein
MDKPWFAEKSVDYLDKILTKEMTLFEYGSGNSTSWFAERVKSITSIEHDEGWYNNINHSIDDNTNLILTTLDKYVDQLNQKYDVIVVDGKLRKECFERAIKYAKKYLIIDDYQRYNFKLDRPYKEFTGSEIEEGKNKITRIYGKN